MDSEKIEKLKKLLKESGYTLVPGIRLEFTEGEREDCGTQCSGGCESGCYTCSPGNSNACVTTLAPTVSIQRSTAMDEILTIEKSEKPLNKARGVK